MLLIFVNMETALLTAVQPFKVSHQSEMLPCGLTLQTLKTLKYFGFPHCVNQANRPLEVLEEERQNLFVITSISCQSHSNSFGGCVTANSAGSDRCFLANGETASGMLLCLPLPSATWVSSIKFLAEENPQGCFLCVCGCVCLCFV